MPHITTQTIIDRYHRVIMRPSHKVSQSRLVVKAEMAISIEATMRKQHGNSANIRLRSRYRKIEKKIRKLWMVGLQMVSRLFPPVNTEIGKGGSPLACKGAVVMRSRAIPISEYRKHSLHHRVG